MEKNKLNEALDIEVLKFQLEMMKKIDAAQDMPMYIKLPFYERVLGMNFNEPLSQIIERTKNFKPNGTEKAGPSYN